MKHNDEDMVIIGQQIGEDFIAVLKEYRMQDPLFLHACVVALMFGFAGVHGISYDNLKRDLELGLKQYKKDNK
jgi:hypothetical protein